MVITVCVFEVQSHMVVVKLSQNTGVFTEVILLTALVVITAADAAAIADVIAAVRDTLDG